MPNQWQIANDPNSPSVGDDLDTLYIQQIPGGYELVSNDIMVGVLATKMTPSQDFKFENVSYGETTWTIHVMSLPPQSQGHGSWITPAPPNSAADTTTPTQTGHFTAQAEIGVGEDDAASSANA